MAYKSYYAYSLRKTELIIIYNYDIHNEYGRSRAEKKMRVYVQYLLNKKSERFKPGAHSILCVIRLLSKTGECGRTRREKMYVPPMPDDNRNRVYLLLYVYIFLSFYTHPERLESFPNTFSRRVYGNRLQFGPILNIDFQLGGGEWMVEEYIVLF